MVQNSHILEMEDTAQYSTPAIEITQQQLSEVRRRRTLAFLVDYLVIAFLVAIASVIVGILGIITLGAAWLLYFILAPLVAITYMALTLGGPSQRTVGMRLFSLKMVNLDGKPTDPAMAILHAVLFWAIHVVGTPAMFIVAFFSSKKRLLHDILLGNVTVRSDVN